MRTKIKELWAKRWVKIAAWVVLVFIIVSFVRGGNGEELTTATVTRDGLVQEVLVQGTVTPASDIELAFDSSGVVSSVRVDVGDEVARGAVLATLANGDVLASLNEARADRDAAQEKLNELTFGTRAEELAVARKQVQSAESAVDDARDGLNDELLDALNSAEDAIRNKVDRFFSNPASIPKIRVGKDNGVKNQVNDLREDTEDILDRWEALVFEDNVLDELDVIRQELGTITQLLNGIAFLVSEQDVPGDVTQTEKDTNTSLVATAQDNVSDARGAIIVAEEKYTAALDALAVEEEELALLEAGARSEAVRQQEAVVAAREATVARRYAEYQKTIITSPIDGVIVRRDIDQGESVSAYESVLKVISGDTLEIEADISELDVSLVAVDDPVRITLDAYGENVIFTGRVIQVDPAETVVDNLPTYGIVVAFDEADARVRSGMTANIRIVTDEKDSVLTVPGAAVIFDQGETVVFVGDERRVVETGTYGSDGRIEIIAGVTEGEEVVIP